MSHSFVGHPGEGDCCFSAPVPVCPRLPVLIAKPLGLEAPLSLLGLVYRLVLVLEGAVSGGLGPKRAARGLEREAESMRPRGAGGSRSRGVGGRVPGGLAEVLVSRWAGIATVNS